MPGGAGAPCAVATSPVQAGGNAGISPSAEQDRCRVVGKKVQPAIDSNAENAVVAVERR